MKATLHFDGGARPKNPGHAGFAAVITMGGKPYMISRYIGIKTNNMAEYTGLRVGIQYAHHLGATELDIFGDSKLVIEQVLDNWQVKSIDLRPLCKDTRRMLDQWYAGAFTLTHIERAKNPVADQMCTEAITWGRLQNPWIPQKLKDKMGVGNIVDPFSRAHTRTHAS